MASKFECKECGLVFNSADSLTCHLTYGHVKKWENEEANNNTTSKKFAPDSSSDVKKSPSEGFQHPPTPQSFSSSPYQHEQQYQQHADLGYLKTEPHSPPIYQQQQYFEPAWEQQQQQQQQYHYAPQRYHPYTYDRPQVSSSFPPQPTPSPSPKQCDKCGFQCELQSQLADHVSMSHPQPPFFFMEQPPVIKEEDVQSEILDLDSHKVHSVYPEEPSEKQRNGDNPHSVNALLWTQKYQQQPQQPMFQTMPPTGNGHANGLDFIQASPTDYPRATPQYEASSTQVPTNPPQTPPTGSTKSTNWKSNEARRPKTYNCTACNKWFTSSGHLKRHYNTTLHKNAVKSSGQPDPATMPISAHHHPAREPSNKDEQHSVSPDEDTNSMPLVQQQQQPQTVLAANPPNGDAGLSLDHSRGLLPSYTMDHHHQFQMYPNGLAPHVMQVTINNHNISGSNFNTNEELSEVLLHELHESAEQDQQLPLPSFAQLNRQANVGGGGPVTAPFTYLENDSYLVFASPAPIFEEHHHHHHQQQQQEQDFTEEVILSCPPPPINNNNLINNNNIINPLLLMPTKPQQLQQQQQQTPEKAHIKRDFEEVASPASPLVSSTTVTSPFSCTSCNKTFNKACYLTQHNKTFHCGEKPFKCQRCGKRFSDNVIFEEHAKKHAGEKPHKCDQCPKQFNHKTDLRRHMCLHSGLKPFSCDSCGKGFIRKDHMQKHCETHTRKQQIKQQQQQQMVVAANQV